MSDRFDITLERKLESKADEADVRGSAVRVSSQVETAVLAAVLRAVRRAS
jgi:hypothetical protein